MNEDYTVNVDTPDALLIRILDADAHIKKREDQISRTTRHLRHLFISL
jgi:hypothetical protein